MWNNFTPDTKSSMKWASKDTFKASTKTRSWEANPVLFPPELVLHRTTVFQLKCITSNEIYKQQL